MEDAVLVLNANYQPIHICNTHRALHLILACRASLVINGRGEIYTVSQAFPRPSVIRLEHMVHRPRLKIPFTRHEVFRRDGYTCQYCGKKNVDFTLDHVIPRKSGGEHTWTNVVTACIHCNRTKGSRTLEETHMHLRAAPGLPPASAIYYFSCHLNANQEWTEFINGW